MSFQLVEDFARGQPCRVEGDGVVRRAQRRDGSGGVPLVPFPLLTEKFLKGNGLPRAFELLLPATGAFLGRGGEEEFAARAGEGDRSLIAAFANDVATGGDDSLLLDERGADSRMTCGERSGTRRLGRSQQIRDVPVADERPAVDKGDGPRLCAGGCGVGFEVDPVLDAQDGDRAVHGAGIQILESQPFGERAGGRAFPGSGRSINRDDHREQSTGERSGQQAATRRSGLEHALVY